MQTIPKTFYILLILNFLIALSCGQQDIRGEKEYPIPSTIIEKELGASTNPSVLSSSSSRSTPIPGQIPIIINKYTKNLKSEYDKGENLTIRIRILNVDRQNKIQNGYLQEEIPEGFRVISPVVNDNTNPKIICIDGIQLLLWNFDKGLPDLKYIEYTLQGNKMGLHNLVSSLLFTNVLDHIGVTHNIMSLSEDLTINIKNNPPELIDYYQENPIYVHLKNNLLIKASFSDLENDTINCNLHFNDTLKSIKPYKSLQNSGKTVFTWDLTNYTDKDQIFYLASNDGESSKTFGPFELKTYKLLEYERYNFSGENVFHFIFGNIGQLLLGLAALFTLFGSMKVITNLRSWRNTGHKKVMKCYNCVLEADKWNKIGLELLQFRKFDESIWAFDNAIEIDKSSPVFLYNKGKALLEKTCYKESVEYFNKAIKIDANFADARNFRDLAMKNIDKATEMQDGR